jgi:hypothetical protein
VGNAIDTFLVLVASFGLSVREKVERKLEEEEADLKARGYFSSSQGH